VLDPFMGSGTTAVVAKRLGRNFVGYETEKEFIEITEKRLRNVKK
jgi:DNA modification methylase